MAGVGVTHLDEALPGQVLSRLAPHHAVAWHMHARSGATTASTLRTLPPHQSDVAVLALGVNDVVRLTPVRRWLSTTEALLDKLEAGGARQIHLSDVPPLERFPAIPYPLAWILGRHAKAMNDALVNMATRRGLFVHSLRDMQLEAGSVARDGFHPGPVTYALWGEKVANAILRTPGTPPAAPR